MTTRQSPSGKHRQRNTHRRLASHPAPSKPMRIGQIKRGDVLPIEKCTHSLMFYDIVTERRAKWSTRSTDERGLDRFH